MNRSAIAAVALCTSLAATACASDDREPSAGPSVTADGAEPGATPAAFAELPVREGARRTTTGDVPHIQTDAVLVPAVDAELRRRAFQLPGVENLESDRSLPGARGLAFASDLELARPGVIAGSREFAHFHPDGSLHVWLPVDRAGGVDEKKWGELHPWIEREGFWDGVVMVYTPESLDEADVAIRILVDAYNFVVGTNLEPSDIP